MAIKVYFGLPGSGKTTHAAKIVSQCLKKHIPVFSNVPIVGAFVLDPLNDCGVVDVSGGVVIIDEAGIDLNNRKFKSMPQSFIEFLKLYRHYHISDIYVYSQAPDDMDITIRRLANEFYIVRRSILPHFSYTRRIVRFIGAIDPQTHQITDGYEYQKFSKRYIFRRRYYGMFDTYLAPCKPPKDWQVYRSQETLTSVE